MLGDPDRPDEPIPPLTPEWLETALEFYLFAKEHFEAFAEPRRALEKQLRQQGLLERRRVHLRHHPHLNNYLSTSLSKLQSIRRIVAFEHQHLGRDLRLVVLTDYIRKEFLSLKPDNDLPLSKMGVLPIFETLRRNNAAGIRLGVLTGSLVLIPAAALPALRAAAHPLEVLAEPLAADPAYVVVQGTAALQATLVHLTTQLFEQGEIEVLVGTKSLLGEGWDAPSINSLVLASFVGSFVLSNQMRGRAIRTQQGNATKTSNIWHLACLDLLAPNGGTDLELLRRRFSTFVGVSLPPLDISIENALQRLGIPDQLPNPGEVEQVNISMFDAAADRPGLTARWQQALAEGQQLVTEIRQPPAFLEPLTRPLPEVRERHYNRSLAWLLAELLTAITWFGLDSIEGFVRQLTRGRSLDELLLFLKLTILAGLLYFGRRAWVVFRLYTAYRDIALDLENIGKALLNTLLHTGTIQFNPQLRIVATAARDGSLSCYLTGGSTFEHSAFVRAMQEILQPIDNPRYVILRKNQVLGLLKQQDYHAVPEELGHSKALAEHFAVHWQQQVGDCELIFTRTIEGRQQLLHARTKALSAVLYERPEPVSRWQ